MANYKQIIPFIKRKEGGLARTKTDTASHNASPCLHKGLKGWHTNKGIQWISFKNNATKLGYNPSCNNFINMPDSIWNKIYKKSYWDAFNLDNSKSQVIANTIVTWAWGSGVGGAYRSLAKFLNKNYNTNYSTLYSYNKAKIIVKELNTIAIKKGENNLFKKLTNWRKQFFIQTGQTANIKGWINRLEDFKAFNENLIKIQLNFAKKYWWVIALATVGTAGIVYASIKYKK